MRLASAALILLLLAAPPAAARTIVDAGVLSLEADLSRTETCPLWDAELCPVGYDGHRTLAPGDDQVFLDKSVQELRIITRPPAGPAFEPVVVDLSEVSVRHPVNRWLNETWPALNGHLPGPLGAFVYFESGTLADDPEDWGVFIGVRTGNAELDPHLKYGSCWDPCFIDGDSAYLRGDEDEFRPFTKDVWVAGTSTDEYLAFYGEQGTPHGLACDPESVVHGVADAYCAATAQVHPAGPAFAAMVASVVPEVVLDYQFNRAVASVAPPPASLGEAGAAQAAAASAIETLAGVPGAERAEPASPRSVPALERPLGSTSIADDPGMPTEGAPALATATMPDARLGSGPAVLVSVAAGVLIAWLLYHRITRATALRLETRRRIFDLIVAEPGVRSGTVARRLGLDPKTVEFHVRLLAGFGLVLAAGEGHRYLFAAGTVDVREANLRAGPLAAPATRAVLGFLRHRQSAPLGEIASELGLALPTVSQAGGRLASAGLVRHERVGKRVVLHMAPTSPDGPAS